MALPASADRVQDEINAVLSGEKQPDLDAIEEALEIEKARRKAEEKELRELEKKARKKAKEEEKRLKEAKRAIEKEQKRLEKEEQERQREIERKAKEEQKRIEEAAKEKEREEKKRQEVVAKIQKTLEKDKTIAADSIKLDELEYEDVKDLKDVDKLTIERLKLKQNEKKALDFIYSSIDETEQDTISKEISVEEEFFTREERDQLLELWRATIARNRTIQFIIKSLAPDPNDLEKNNAVVQALSKAIFVPFYAVSAVANNSAISAGSAAGARVLGEVVQNVNDNKSKTDSITKTEMVVMFMLVDEVAERLRESFRGYKLAKIQRDLLKQDLLDAQLQEAEAAGIKESAKTEETRLSARLAELFTSVTKTRLERELKRTSMETAASRSTLVELAGSNAVSSVDVLIDLEVETLLGESF